MAFDLEKELSVTGGNVLLTVKLGDGQHGTSSVVVAGIPVVAGSSIIDHDLGSGESLKGKSIVIVSTVHLLNEQSQHTTISYLLKNTAPTDPHVTTKVSPGNGQAVQHRAKFNIQ